MSEPTFVRVMDPQTGYHRTAHVSEVRTNKALKVLDDHDAVDANGNPLPPKFTVEKGTGRSTAAATIITGDAGKGGDSK